MINFSLVDEKMITLPHDHPVFSNFERVILLVRMVPEEKVYMEPSLMMKISRYDIPAWVYYPWQIPVPIQMVPNSSCVRPRPRGWIANMLCSVKSLLVWMSLRR